MKYKDDNLKTIDRLFKPKTFHSSPVKKSHTGIDTETTKHGNMVLIASDSDHVLNRTGIGTYDALNFISQYRNNYVWFFNLQFDFDAIIKKASYTVKKQSREHRAFQDGEFIVSTDNRIYAVNQTYGKNRKKQGTKSIIPIGYQGKEYFYIEYRTGKSLIIHKHTITGKWYKTTCFDISNFLNSGVWDAIPCPGLL